MERALAAAENLAGEGVSVEVIDPRTLVPLDMATILDSVLRTHRALIVHEACELAGQVPRLRPGLGGSVLRTQGAGVAPGCRRHADPAES